MENLSLAQHIIPNSQGFSEYFSACYKLSSDQFSFYISLIFSIFQSISAHRLSAQGQALYSNLMTYIGYHQDYFKYLMGLLGLFKAEDLDKTFEVLENLIKTEGAISKLAGLSWALVGMISGLELGSERCMVYSRNSSVFEVICEKLGISLAVFTEGKVFYVRPVDGRILLWVYEENFSSLILIVKKESNKEGYPLIYIEKNQKPEGFEVAYENLEAFGPRFTAFESQLYFTGSPLGDYLALITSLSKAIKLNLNKELALLFYRKLNEAIGAVKNMENEQHLQFLLEFFWFFLNSQDVQIEQYLISQKEHLIYVTQGFQILGQAYKNRILEFPEYLEFFSNQFDLCIVVYQIQGYYGFNIENSEGRMSLYLSEVGKVYRCLVLKEFEEIQGEPEVKEGYIDGVKREGDEVGGEIFNEPRFEHLEVFDSEAKEAFHVLTGNLIKIKKSILSTSEIESIAPQIAKLNYYMQNIQLQSIFNPTQCQHMQHQGLYFSLECYHTYCIQCLSYQVSLETHSTCAICKCPISDRQKLKIFKKSFKVNKIEYKTELKPKPQPIKKSVVKKTISFKKCNKCKNDVDPSYFSIIPCMNNCLICVNCRLEEQGKCFQCQSVYSDEKKEAVSKLEIVRKSGKSQKQLCDHCKYEFDIKYFFEFCKACRICVKCSVKTDRCPNCMGYVNQVRRICDSCSKEFTIKDTILIPCQYGHLYHTNCCLKGGRCYKCTKTPKKNNR